MRAKFIKAIQDTNPFNKHAWEHTVLVYEYRGHKYFIDKANNGCLEDPMWKQHQENQRAIDEMIARENEPAKEWRYEGSGQEGFDIFWKFVEEGE